MKEKYVPWAGGLFPLSPAPEKNMTHLDSGRYLDSDTFRVRMCVRRKGSEASDWGGEKCISETSDQVFESLLMTLSWSQWGALIGFSLTSNWEFRKVILTAVWKWMWSEDPEEDLQGDWIIPWERGWWLTVWVEWRTHRGGLKDEEVRVWL